MRRFFTSSKPDRLAASRAAFISNGTVLNLLNGKNPSMTGLSLHRQRGFELHLIQECLNRRRGIRQLNTQEFHYIIDARRRFTILDRWMVG